MGDFFRSFSKDLLREIHESPGVPADAELPEGMSGGIVGGIPRNTKKNSSLNKKKSM